jgi:hypothetical protein
LKNKNEDNKNKNLISNKNWQGSTYKQKKSIQVLASLAFALFILLLII